MITHPQEDIYDFWGHEIYVRSGSSEALGHLRHMYGRFHRGTGKAPPSPDEGNLPRSRSGLEVTDRLEEDNEFRVRNAKYLYRLSRARGTWYFESEDIRSGARGTYGSCSPRTLLQASFLEHVAMTTREHHFVHAGAVAKEGAGVLFPAMSMLGKTTLVVKLVMRGFAFLSDEVGCFRRRDFLLEPFPRKVNLRKSSRDILGLPMEPPVETGTLAGEGEEIAVDIDELVKGSLSVPCFPRYLIFLGGFGEMPRLEPFSGPTALIHLLQASITPIEDPAGLMMEFAPLMGAVECFHLVMGSPDATADLVSRLVECGPERVG
jgi:hypothetical protein